MSSRQRAPSSRLAHRRAAAMCQTRGWSAFTIIRGSVRLPRAWHIAAPLLALSCLASFITAAFGIGGGGVMLAALATLLPCEAVLLAGRRGYP